ncbi:MAG: tRNA (adenosine(37)-N6)-threonylcarbamoyltransferase complex transferase subunit TsaD [Nitrospirae bacterium]|nr:tRNA (adenosine(37)-N6)-threonylcarbamoyltransferase complex transferase subunit TsaD [Nitrospirota bacterium]
MRTPVENPIILAIESSCDETAVALLQAPGTVLGQALASQVGIHERFGGVVPEVASRAHLEQLDPLLTQALGKAGRTLADVDAVAVTSGPGLLGAVLVGLSYAKALAWGLGVPLIGVHHLEAHVAAALLHRPDVSYPFLALVVSGGHTSLYRVDAGLVFTELGRTIDDAAGEALDKGAKMMGLPYPGGPHIERLARDGRATAVDFPRAWLGRSLDFSFSGLKTALRVHLEKTGATPDNLEDNLPDIAASYQEAVVDVLATKALWAAEREGLQTLVVAGGVAANGRLGAVLAARGAREGVDVVVPPPALCTDNAVMVAVAGARMLAAGRTASLTLDADARAPITTATP